MRMNEENHSFALLTDLYQLTMVYGYWKSGLIDLEAVFHLNFRRWPFKGGFAIAAGLETAVRFIKDLSFSPDDLSYLASLKEAGSRPLFESAFLDFLSTFDFSCDVDALPEGTVVFPHEPLLRVVGPLWQAQMLESFLLNILNFQTLIATKAARMRLAAAPDPIIEFGIRRAQGIDGAISASRASFIGGCSATSNLLAGKLFDIPVRGTHSHSWVMAFDDEKKAFQTFANVMPSECIFLIDTYNSISGAKHAIEIAEAMENTKFSLAGVRLDSGDLSRLSIEVRRILDRAGLSQTKIMASNELDEYLIRDLKQQGACIDVWGVGTHLVTGKDQPALDGVYKLSAIRAPNEPWEYRLKLSDQTAKVTNPGILQIRRFFDGEMYQGDALYDEKLGIESNSALIDQTDPDVPHFFSSKWKTQDLLQPIFRKGTCVYEFPSLHTIQNYAIQELQRLPAPMQRFTNPQPYFVGLEKRLYEKKIEIIRSLKKREN